MASDSLTVNYIYEAVIADVLNGVQELFLANGIDNSVVQELKQTWTAKLLKNNALSECNNVKTMAKSENKSISDEIILVSQPTDNMQTSHINLNKQPMTRMSFDSNFNTVINLPPQTTFALQNQASSSGISEIRTINSATKIKPKTPRCKEVIQIDGLQDSSDEDDSISEQEECSNGNDLQKEHESPLNSDDDISEEDEGFDTQNIIVCQYEKIIRRSNKWKLYLKSGIMHVDGKDHIFKSFIGETKW